MRIRDLTAWHVRIPLKTTVRHASHTRRETDSVVVRCRMDDGSEGWGEGLPREYVTGETIDSALNQLDGTDLFGQLGDSYDNLDASSNVHFNPQTDCYSYSYSNTIYSPI